MFIDILICVHKVLIGAISYPKSMIIIFFDIGLV